MITNKEHLANATERQEQMALIEWIKWKHPWLLEFTIYIINEQQCAPHIGMLMNKMGRNAGASDLFIAWPTSHYYGLFIEMKSKKGRASVKQLDFIERMKQKGYQAIVCHGAKKAMDVISDYLKTPII